VSNEEKIFRVEPFSQVQLDVATWGIQSRNWAGSDSVFYLITLVLVIVAVVGSGAVTVTADYDQGPIIIIIIIIIDFGANFSS